MREILFRGKRVDNGEWVEGYYSIFGAEDRCDGLAMPYRNLHCITRWCLEDDMYDNAFEVVPETVGQFTGLLDKNRVRIFEGDKVVVEYDDELPGVVVWDGDEMEWGIDCEGVQMKMGCFYSKDIEVIGNIHEVPNEN